MKSPKSSKKLSFSKKSPVKKSALRGGRRTFLQKLFQSKCSNELNFEDQEPIDPQYALRITENNHSYCFDARSLYKWLITFKHKTNPFTNTTFDDKNVLKIYKKFVKLKLVKEISESDFLNSNITTLNNNDDNETIRLFAAYSLQLLKRIIKIYSDIKINDLYIICNNFSFQNDDTSYYVNTNSKGKVFKSSTIIIRPNPKTNQTKIDEEIEINELLEYNLYVAVPQFIYYNICNLLSLNYDSYQDINFVPTQKKGYDYETQGYTQFINSNFSKIKLYDVQP